MDIRAGLPIVSWDIIIDDQLPADLSDMSTTFNKKKALKPDILIVSGHSFQGVNIASSELNRRNESQRTHNRTNPLTVKRYKAS